MKAKRNSSHFCQAAIRQRLRREELIGEGDFAGAFKPIPKESGISSLPWSSGRVPRAARVQSY